jgi:hypothetical protein
MLACRGSKSARLCIIHMRIITRASASVAGDKCTKRRQFKEYRCGTQLIMVNGKQHKTNNYYFLLENEHDLQFAILQ